MSIGVAALLATCTAALDANEMMHAATRDPALLQAHLSFGPPSGSSNTYRLVFQTNSTTTPGASAAGGLVKWGASPASLATTVAAGCRSYSIADMCGAPANSSANFIAPGFIFDALLTIPATHAAPVYYCISADGGKTWSPVKAFRNGPKSIVQGGVQGGVQGRTKFLAFGDMGVPSAGSFSAENSTALLEERVGDADFVLHVGDLSYAVGRAHIWSEFGHQIAGIASVVPYMVAIGNHEYDFPGQPFTPKIFTYGTDGGGECGLPYNARYHMPGPELVAGPGDYVITANRGASAPTTPAMPLPRDYGPRFDPRLYSPTTTTTNNNSKRMPGDGDGGGGGGGAAALGAKSRHVPGSEGELPAMNNLFYSFQIGNVHVAVLSSEHNMTVGSTQLQWLDADLAAVNRTETPWVVFGEHRPFFDSSSASLLPELGFLKKMLEPTLLKHKVDLALFGHIHQYTRTCRMVDHKCNDAGPVYMVIGTAGATTQVPFIPKALEPWVKVQSMLWGISSFDAVNSSHMHVQWIQDKDSIVGDDFWITRGSALLP
eukprot:gene15403-28678_t